MALVDLEDELRKSFEAILEYIDWSRRMNEDIRCILEDDVQPDCIVEKS